MSGKIPAVGTLTDRVQLARKTMVPEPEGGHATVYVPMATVWARVRSLAGRMAVVSDARAASVSHSVVLRFRGDIAPGDRVSYRGRSLEIVSAADMNGRRAYLACQCSETRTAG
jgi:SPP1 family predicted phage head-tail adaptor